MPEIVSKEIMDTVIPVIKKIFDTPRQKFTSQIIRECIYENCGVGLSSAELRVVIHEVRVRSHVHNLVAGRSGYWVAKDYKEVQDYVGRLQNRAMQIHEVQAALKLQMQNSLIGQTSI